MIIENISSLKHVITCLLFIPSPVAILCNILHIIILQDDNNMKQKLSLSYDCISFENIEVLSLF